MKKILSIVLCLCVSTPLISQSPKKSRVLGTYVRSGANPNRNITKDDGAQINISYLESEHTLLVLKRFNKLQIIQSVPNSATVAGKTKGTWELKNDTVVLRYAGTIWTYRFKEPGDLISLENKHGYQKQLPKE